jgi:drug/metabolite transporter (DMT)-like permease
VNTERLALLAAAVVGIQVGACIAGSRWVVHELGPVSLTFLRYAIGLASLLPFLVSAPRALRQLNPREVTAVVLLGITQFGVLIALLNIGLSHVGAGLGALLFATFPLMTMTIATALGHERFDAALAAGVVLSVVGVGIALAGPLGFGPKEMAKAMGDRGFALGVVCVLASALCGAGCSVLYRPLLQRHAMLPLGALAMAAAVAVLLPAAWIEGLPARAAALGAAQWTVVAAVGLSSGVAYWVWLWALKHTAPTKATAFLALSPVTATLIGTALMGEPAGWGLVAGVVCILAGLALTAKRRVQADPLL